jgi:hypothetical protein
LVTTNVAPIGEPGRVIVETLLDIRKQVGVPVEFVARLPHGSVAVVADTAYLVPYENPAATIRLVRQFWLDHGSPVGVERAASLVA